MPSFRKLLHIHSSSDTNQRSRADGSTQRQSGRTTHEETSERKTTDTAPPTAPAAASGASSQEGRTKVGLAHAQSVLKEAAEKLEKSFPETVQERFHVKPVQGCADINAMSQNLEDAIGQVLEAENIESNEQLLVKAVTNSWFKKAIPWVQKGLSVAGDVVPAPYGLVITGLLYVVERAKTISETSDKVNDVLEYISQAVQNVGVDPDFPRILQQKQLDEIQSAALYLTASLMDCLSVLVEYVTESATMKALISNPDLDGAKASVKEKAQLYSQATVKITAALQASAVSKQQDEEILEWIWPVSQLYNKPKGPDDVGKSGDWFLTSLEYRNWVGQGPSTLICTGQPGAGKSHIHSVIFNKLQDTPQIGILFYLFKNANREQTANDVIRILLCQLLKQCQGFPESIHTAYTKSKSRNTTADLETLTRFLCSTVLEFSSTYSSPVFILLDAFDEFQNEKEPDHQREGLLSCLAKVVSTGSVKLLITTRLQYRDELQTNFSGAIVTEVKTDHDDVEKYLDRQMDRLSLSKELKDTIKVKIISEADQLWFLLVTLQTQYVLEVRDPIKIRKRLTSLPRDPNEAYKSVLERMSDKQFAGRILGWILHAQTVLTMVELQTALSFDSEGLQFFLDDAPMPESIVETCGGLIEHRRDTGIVMFSHAVVRQYLTDHPLPELESHPTMALACLMYCQIPELETIVGEFEADMRKEKMPLGDYAIRFWPVHSKLAGRNLNIETKILETFNSTRRRHAARVFSLPLRECWLEEHTLLQFLIENGASEVVLHPLSDSPAIAESVNEMLSPSNIDRKNATGYTAFMLAAGCGSLDVARWLSGKGAEVNINATGWENRTALDLAAEGGHLEVVKWLVNEKGMDIHTTSGVDNGNIYHRAAQSGNMELFRWLTDEKKVDINTINSDGESCLHLAAAFGHLELVKWLVDEKKLDASVTTIHGRNPLLNAISKGHFEIVKWLVLERNLDLTVLMDSWGQTALHVACQKGHLEISKWLVDEQGFDANLKTMFNFIPLHSAAWGGALEVVQWLVEEKGAKVDAIGDNGDTPRTWAQQNPAVAQRTVQWLEEREKGGHVPVVEIESVLA